VPSNISLLFIGEGQLSVASGISVTISSRPMADPRRQIFGGSGTVTFAAEATDELWLEWWGADSTGATDSTTAIAAWLSAAQDSEIRARVGSGSFLYSGSGFSLSSRFPGIVGNGIFQTQFHADISAGQTALTVNMSGRTGLYSGFSVWAGAPGESVATARATARNGILWTGNGGQCHIADVKVYNFAGFGQKFEDIFDTIIDNMIVESCGNATEYAWSVTQSVGTSNHLQFNRPQVELSYEKAIYVHPNTLSCVFLGLHSERTTGNGVDYTHVLNAGSWLAARIEATSDVYLKIGGPNGSYRDFRCPDVAVEFSYGAAGQCVIDNLSCASLYVLPSNVVKCTARNLKISGELRIETGNFVVRDSVGLTHLNLYGNSAIVQMFNCAVSGSHSVTGNPSLTAVDCTFAEAPPYDGVNLYRCTLNGAWTMPAAQKIVAVDCTFTAAITLAVTGTRFRARNCDFQAALGYSSGDAFGILDAACIVGSTVAAEWYGAPSAGTWAAGDRRYDPLPSAGGVEGSICVAAGTPGTWKNLGSVAL